MKFQSGYNKCAAFFLCAMLFIIPGCFSAFAQPRLPEEEKAAEELKKALDIPVTSENVSSDVRDAEEEEAYVELLTLLCPEMESGSPESVMEVYARKELTSALDSVLSVRAEMPLEDISPAESEKENTLPLEPEKSEPFPEETISEEPVEYSVTPPTEVCWTDNFEMSWTFGKDPDGELHHMYAYVIYNESSPEPISNGTGLMSPGGTSISLGLGSWVVEKMDSGNYYFEVYALDESRTQQMSESVRSDTKSFKRPSWSLPIPENPRWDGTQIYWDYPEEAAALIGNSMHFELYYCDTEDGDYQRVGTQTLKYQPGLDMRNRDMKEKGYYKFRVQIYSKDIQKILSSDYSDFSEVMYYDGE